VCAFLILVFSIVFILAHLAKGQCELLSSLGVCLQKIIVIFCHHLVSVSVFVNFARFEEEYLMFSDVQAFVMVV
jgi:hypothetical protein